MSARPGSCADLVARTGRPAPDVLADWPAARAAAAAEMALYGCSFDDCATEQSFPADDLRWSATEGGFLCEGCWDLGDDDEPRGPTLAECLSALSRDELLTVARRPWGNR